MLLLQLGTSETGYMQMRSSAPDFLGAGAVSRMQLGFGECVPIPEAVLLLCAGTKLMEILAAQTGGPCSASPAQGGLQLEL